MRWLCAILLFAAAATADHEVLRLDCPKEIEYRVVRDLDGDGLDEILMVNRQEAWIWKGRREKTGAAPDARIQLPEGAALFDVGDAGGGGQEFVVRTRKAYWALRPGVPPRRLEHVSGPGLPVKSTTLLWRGFFHDLDLDGKADFVDVSLQGYRIDFAAGGSTLLPALVSERCETSAQAASERLIARYALGEWAKGNFDGDLRPDFAVMTPRGLIVHTGDAKGRFHASRTLEIELPEAAEAELTYADFNRDGRTDLLAVAREEGEATLLLADTERGLRSVRRRRLKLPGEMRYPVVTDFNRDGLVDLALPYLPRVTVEDAVRVVLRNEVFIKVPLFLNRGGEHCFRPVADNQMTLPVRVRMGTDSAGRIRLSGLIVVEYEGDMDGDGRRDLIVTRKPDLLGVHKGVPETIFRDEVSARIPIPDASEFDQIRTVAANLNGDDLSDIILHYRGAGRRPDRLFVLWSRKK
jgi:hypothetical protein